MCCGVETERGWGQLYWGQDGDGRDGINGDEDGMRQYLINCGMATITTGMVEE